jgi:protein-S-isoprenylcysteine O-methyltransferase Ste14
VTAAATPASAPPPAAPAARSPAGAALGAVLAASWLAAPFAGAGTSRWAGGFVYLGLLASGLAAHAVFVRRHAPGLAARRARVGEGTPAWDLAWVSVFWPSMVAAPAVAGVDVVRLGHAPLPLWLAFGGVLVLGFAMGLSAGAMATNPFFEGTVRLQPGQRVVDQGPYATIRHPGYAALALWALATPLVLRSRWALVPGLFSVAWVLLRTGLEDAFLRRGLPGYSDYSRRVRARILPGIW